MDSLKGIFDYIDSPFVIGPIAAIIGFLLKAVWDRFISERMMPTVALIERPRPTEYGIKRLRREALRALNEISANCSPPAKGEKRYIFPENDIMLYIRTFHIEDNCSSCPQKLTEEGILPLYVALHKAQGIGDVADEYRIWFQTLMAEDENGKRLIKGVDIDGITPLLWIYFPNLIIHTRLELTQLLAEIFRLARSRIKNVRVVLEIYLSLDIIEYLCTSDSSDLIMNLQSILKSNQFEITRKLQGASSYTFHRDVASLWLRKGQIIGELGPSRKYDLPRWVIDLRWQQIFAKPPIEKNTWSIMSIYGPAGSGKSATSLFFAEILKTDYSAICLCFSSPSLLNVIIELASCNINKEEAIGTITEAFASDKYIPAKYHDTYESAKAFTDALNFHLIERESPIYIIVDDIHAHRETESALIKLWPIMKEWNIKYLIIGRKKFAPSDIMWSEDCSFELHCNYFGKKDAQDILEYWSLDDIPKKAISTLDRGWPSHHSEYSTYLLRMLFDNIDDIQSSPNELMKEAINRHLSSFEKVILYQSKSDGGILRIVKQMLIDNEPREKILEVFRGKQKIDVTLLFGLLAWHANYGEQTGFLDAKLIPKWSSGMIPSEEVAHELLKAGRDAEVFIMYRGGADWRDKIIAEGCTALYLIYEMDRMIHDSPEIVNNTIAQMIDKLASSNSIDILPLALDVPDMVRIVEAIARADRRYLAIASKIITPEFITRLSGDSRWVDKIADIIFKRAQLYNEEKIVPFALVLAKLTPFSKNLELYYEEMAKGDGGEARLANCIAAIRYKNSKQYFEYASSLGVDDIMAAEIAALSWGIEGGPALFDRLCEFESKKKLVHNINRIWDLWCNNQDIGDVTEYSLDLVKHCVDKKTDSIVQYTLASHGLLKPIELKIKPRDQCATNLKKIISVGADTIQPVIMGRLIRALAYYSCPDIVGSGSEWVYNQKGKYALPRESNDPMLVKNIFAKIRKGFPAFYIPSKDELCALKFPVIDQPELIRDGFPKDFLGEDDQVFPSNFKFWDGENIEYFRKDEVNTRKISWRPVFRIEMI